MDAPEKLCFVNCGLPADQCACYRQYLDATFLPTILATEHDRIVAEKDAEIARLREALRPFSEALSVYRNFSEHQLILLSEDNPKGRRLAHLLPEQFAVARAALKGDDNG